MSIVTKLQEAFSFIKSRKANFIPKIGLVLGSGLSRLAENIADPTIIPYSEIPGFSETTVSGHKGALLLGYLEGVPIACLQGRAHYYEGKTHLDIQIPIRTLKLLGCHTLILTNAAASLRNEVPPGNLVLIQDHINFQFQNPLVGPNEECFGPRFPSLQDAYNEELISLALQAGKELGIYLTTGVYLATLGPCYETPAEIRAFKMLGADLVGMSTVPEVIVARHSGLKVLGISTITNMGCGMSDEFLTHEKVLEVAKKAADNLLLLLTNVIKQM